MSNRAKYVPGAATGAEIQKDGDKWTLVLVRELRHPPSLVWEALTEPAHLAEWAPFDADRALTAGAAVKLTTIGAPADVQVSEATVKRADAPKLLEYSWGGGDLRWQLEAIDSGTRLTLWHNINRGFIAWGAAGWHICLDVLRQLLAGEPIGRMVGPEVAKFEGWQRLSAEYGEQFGIKNPSWKQP
jgi:uncharacterized protein YndB with AHSA1/START domain